VGVSLTVRGMAQEGNKQITVRMNPESRKNLRAMAKAYGVPVAPFVREMLNSVCSGDTERVAAFLGKLNTGLARQLLLDLEIGQKRRKRRGRASPG
jgi:hypothetical protein